MFPFLIKSYSYLRNNVRKYYFMTRGFREASLHIPFAYAQADDGLHWAHMSCGMFSLRKHAYSNIQKISPPKTENFQVKNWYFSYFCSKHRLWVLVRTSLEPPRRGGSNEYPQSMFLSRNKKNNVYPCKPQFYYIKMGFKGVKII